MPSPVWWEHLAFVFLISECEKNPPGFSGHSCWMKVFDTYPWLKKERFFMNADGLLVQIWMKRKIPSYVMQRSAFPLWNRFCGELREEEGREQEKSTRIQLGEIHSFRNEENFICCIMQLFFKCCEFQSTALRMALTQFLAPSFRAWEELLWPWALPWQLPCPDHRDCKAWVLVLDSLRIEELRFKDDHLHAALQERYM